jgi:hypothetical protein
MQKITLDQAKLEVIGFLQEHDLETDTTLMLEEDAQEFNEILEAVAKPVSQGRAIIDGDKYVLTLREPIGDTKEVSVSGMSAADMFAADKAKKGNEMAKTGHMIASMVKLTFAEVNRMKSQDFMLLSRLSGLFMAV